jgi:hypothetical protein
VNHEKRYREIEAKLNYLQAKKDLFTEAEKLLKKEFALIQDEMDELTKELLSIVQVLRKS